MCDFTSFSEKLKQQFFITSVCFCFPLWEADGTFYAKSKTLLTLLHSEWPKLYGVLAVLSAIGLKARCPSCDFSFNL